MCEVVGASLGSGEAERSVVVGMETNSRVSWTEPPPSELSLPLP